MFEIIKELILGVKDKGIKSILGISFLILTLSLFISPSYTFIFVFTKEILKENVLEIVFLIGVISSILFIFIYIMVSPFLSIIFFNKEKKEKENSNKEEQVLWGIFISLLIMGVISSILFVGNILYKFSEYKLQLKLGILLSFCSIFAILIIGIISWGYLLKLRKEKYKFNKVNTIISKRDFKELEKQKQIEKELDEIEGE